MAVYHNINILFQLFSSIPRLGEIGALDGASGCLKRVIVGGEKRALEDLTRRLHVEESAFKAHLYQPNQARPNLLGPPMTLSAAISAGALSIRLYYSPTFLHIFRPNLIA